MAKKGKKVATPKLTLQEQKVAEELAGVQEVWKRLVDATDKKEEREWVLVPIAIPSIDDQEKFVRAVANARVELRRYADWEDAQQAARELSNAGGIMRVFILSAKKTSRIDMVAEYVDGSSSHRKK